MDSMYFLRLLQNQETSNCTYTGLLCGHVLAHTYTGHGRSAPRSLTHYDDYMLDMSASHPWHDAWHDDLGRFAPGVSWHVTRRFESHLGGGKEIPWYKIGFLLKWSFKLLCCMPRFLTHDFLLNHFAPDPEPTNKITFVECLYTGVRR